MPPTKTKTARLTKGSKRKPVARRPKGCPPAPMVRTSERSSFGDCLWMWHKSYVEQLTPVVDAPALRFGSLVHAALELRYPPGIKRGPKPAGTFEKLFDKELSDAEKLWGFRDADGDWANAKELGVNMLEGYVKEYGRDEEWKVIASEMTFKVPVYSPEYQDGQGGWMGLDGKRYPIRHVIFYYVGTMDGVWQNRMDDGIAVNDYKTTKGDPEKEAEGKATLDEQATAYWTWGVDWLLKKGVIKPKQQLDGMLYTFLKKAWEDERPRNAQGQCLNKDGSVSQKQPTKRFHRDIVYRDREQCERARIRAIHQVMEMYQRRTGGLPIYKTPGTGFPHQQCKACAFFDLCDLDEIGQDYRQLEKVAYKDWDPYDAHEIAEEGKR